MRFSKDILALNPGLDAPTLRKAREKTEDRADLLQDQLRTHAPDLHARFTRDLPFQTFRIDLADPLLMLAIEVNGGLKRGGGGKHATSRDHEKVRELQVAGWLTLVFTSSEVFHDPLHCIAWVRRAVAVRTQLPSFFCADMVRMRTSQSEAR